MPLENPPEPDFAADFPHFSDEAEPRLFPVYPGTLIASFLDRCALDPETGCWNWLGKMSHNRYPVWLFFGKSGSALTLAWELFIGPPPTPGRIRRTCANPRCVRPDHLQLSIGTRMKGRRSATRKLSPAAILFIRSSGLSKRALAEKFGVTPWTIWAVRTGYRGALTSFEPQRVFADPTEKRRTLEIQRIGETLKRKIAGRAEPEESAPANPSQSGTTPPEVECLR